MQILPIQKFFSVEVETRQKKQALKGYFQKECYLIFPKAGSGKRGFFCVLLKFPFWTLDSRVVSASSMSPMGALDPRHPGSPLNSKTPVLTHQKDYISELQL